VTLPVRITPEAETQIRDIHGWWRQNRTAAPDLFLNELSDSFALLAEAPQIGRRYRQSPVSDVRRIVLKGSRYHVYYVSTSDEVKVLAVWHAQRGLGPPLRAS
jgi:plasmid stabilization system protein ParE